MTKHQFQQEAVNRGLNDLHGFVGNQSCDATPLRGRTAEEVAMEKNSKKIYFSSFFLVFHEQFELTEVEANRFLVAAVTFSPLLSSAFLREALQQVSDRTSPTASSLLAGSERKVSTRVELKLDKEKKKPPFFAVFSSSPATACAAARGLD